jgi:hypothetical protein
MSDPKQDGQASEARDLSTASAEEDLELNAETADSVRGGQLVRGGDDNPVES